MEENHDNNLNGAMRRLRVWMPPISANKSRLKLNPQIAARKKAVADKVARLKAAALRYKYLAENPEATTEVKKGKLVVQPRRKGRFAGRQVSFE